MRSVGNQKKKKKKKKKKKYFFFFFKLFFFFFFFFFFFLLIFIWLASQIRARSRTALRAVGDRGTRRAFNMCVFGGVKRVLKMEKMKIEPPIEN